MATSGAAIKFRTEPRAGNHAMPRATASPIEYLVGRRFPDLRALQHPPSPTPGRNFIPNDLRQKRLREVEDYRASLKSKSPEELDLLLEQEKNSEAEFHRTKFEREERERPFNRPHANADFSHWSKAAFWTHEEAVALAFGKSPEVVNWKVIEPYVNVSPLAREYGRLRDLVIRAKKSQQLLEPILPALFLAWARRMDIVVPAELIDAIEARGIVIADWKDLYDQQKAQSDMLLEDRDRIADMARQLIKQRDTLKQRVDHLDQQANAWEFDDSAGNYPEELDVAMQAWRAVSMKPDPSMTVKQQLRVWLKRSYPALSEEARERIATLCNWEKRGGRRSLSA